jgi:hypothetical protein
MDYLVIGEDGTEYGPASVSTLSDWVKEGRIASNTRLKDFQSGLEMAAGALPQLFPPVNLPPQLSLPSNQPAANPYASPPSPYPRTAPTAGSKSRDPGSSDVWWAIGRSSLAIVIALLLPTAGVITAAYSIFYAVRANQAGHRLGKVAIGVSVSALIIVLGLAFLRPHSPVQFR